MGPDLTAKEIGLRTSRVRHVLTAAIVVILLVVTTEGGAQEKSRLDVVVSREQLETKAPDRDRTLRQLAFHVFRLSAGFADCREQGRFPEAWLLEEVPPEMQDGTAIAEYGQRVRGRLAAFCARPGWCEGRVGTYYGEQTAHELMERTTWHAAQHVRQVYWFLDRRGIGVDEGLSERDLQGLPIPKAVWS